MSLSLTVSWDSDATNPNSTTLLASNRTSQQPQGPVLMALGGVAARQRNQVGFASVVQLAIPVGLGMVV